MLNLLISLIILILLITYNIYTFKKNKHVYKSELFSKIKKIKILCYIISIIIFITFFIINLIPLGNNPTIKQTLTCLVNSLSVALLSVPISLETLYLRFFNNEEKYSHIKTVITNIYDENIINKFNESDINVILLSGKRTKLKTINEDKITSNILMETIQIKTKDLKILNKKINKENTIKEFNNLEDLYIKIEQSRGNHDNYIRTIKYLVSTYLSIILSYIFISIMSFPIYYNLLVICMLKIFTTLKTEYIFKHLPYDKDIMTRKVKPNHIIMGKQETMFLIMESFIISFAITIPYMYILASGGSLAFASTMSIVIILIINTLLPYYYLNDSSYIINLFREIKNIRLHIFTIITIIFILIFNFTTYFETKNITLYNNLGSLAISAIFITILEIPKIARFTSKKGKKKHEHKNNKKQRRSQSNHS